MLARTVGHSKCVIVDNNGVSLVCLSLLMCVSRKDIFLAMLLAHVLGYA